jgi:hypothetical protein
MKHATLAAVVLAALLPMRAEAQSLIVGIPNAETTPRGRFAVTHESQALVFRGPAAWNSFSFITYGVRDHLEASVSLTNLAYPQYGDLVLGAGFKWVIPVLEHRLPDWELRLTVGQMSLFSLDRSAIGGWGYAHASARLPLLRTRLTAGVSYGSELLFGAGNNPVSFMAGIEQPITPWLWLVADWYSGTHALGAFIPAVQFNIGERVALIFGFKRDNDRTAPRDGVIGEVMVLL